MKKWLLRVTPFIVVVVLAIVGMMYFLLFKTNNWSESRYMMLLFLLPFTIVTMVFDIMLWRYIKRKYWLWLIEIFALLAAIYFWIIQG